MKNKMPKHHENVLAFIKGKNNVDYPSIKEGNNKISEVLLKQIIKDLQESGLIAVHPDDGTYSIATPKKVAATAKPQVKDEKKEAVKAETKPAAKKKEDEDLGPATISGRDQTRYDFYSQKALSKGRLAHAIIKKYVTDHPKIVFSKLEELFKNKNVQVRYGIFATVQAAHKHTKNERERYFLKQEDIIKVGPQKTAIAVTNQWDVRNISELIKISRALGMKITVATK